MEKVPTKRKAQPSTSRKNSKQCKIENNTEIIDVENFNFELEERKLAFRERELQIQSQEAAAKKALAEAEALELANLEKKKALGLL